MKLIQENPIDPDGGGDDDAAPKDSSIAAKDHSDASEDE